MTQCVRFITVFLPFVIHTYTHTYTPNDVNDAFFYCLGLNFSVFLSSFGGCFGQVYDYYLNVVKSCCCCCFDNAFAVNMDLNRCRYFSWCDCKCNVVDAFDFDVLQLVPLVFAVISVCFGGFCHKTSKIQTLHFICVSPATKQKNHYY